MHVSYELREDDLIEVQAQLILVRRERLKASPLFLPAVMLAVLPFAWLLRGYVLRSPAVREGTLPGVLHFLTLFACAGAAVFLLLPYLRRLPSSPRLDAWSARRMAREAARRTAFGAVTLTLTETQVVRRNDSGELQLAWARVKDVLASPRLLTLRIDDGRQALLLPARAFPDEAAFLAARAEVERLTGKRSLVLDPEQGVLPSGASPAGGSPPRRLRPAYLVALGVALLFLVQHLVTRRYYDPRPGNPEGSVVVYSTAWCPVCASLRECLQRSQIPFEERDVDRSARAESEWEQLDGTGVPVTLVGQQVLYGFDREEMKAALAAAGHRLECGAATDGS